MVIPDLLYNLFGLVAMCVISGFIDIRWSRESVKGTILQGLIFGIIAFLGMLYPYSFVEGIIFDGRSITLSLCTLFFGPLAGLIASFMAISYRFYLAGPGATMGILVIISSFLIGWLFYYLRRTSRIRLGIGWLFSFGVMVHVAMILLMFTLPMQIRKETMKLLTLTILGAYPLITVLAGKILHDQEKQKTSLQKIKEEQQRLKSTIYSINEAVITTDSHGRIQQINPIAESLTGWKELEARGESISKIYRIADYEIPGNKKSLIEKLLTGQITEGCSDQVILLDRAGKSVPVNENVSPIRNDHGQIIGAVLIFRDNSVEKAQLKEFMDSSALFQSAFHSSPVPMALINADNGAFLDVNEMFITESGFSRDHIIGISAVNLMLSTNPVNFRMALDTLRTEGVIKAFPFTIRDNREKNRSCLLSANRISINSQDLFLVSIVDVTGQKEAMKSLSESEQRFREIFDKHSAVKLLIDPETTSILDANQAATEFYGYSREVLLKKRMHEINILPENELLKAIDSIFSEQRVRFEFKHR